MEQWPEPQVPPATILHVAITSWSTHLRCLAVVLPHQTMACKQDAYSLVLPPRTHLYSSSMLVECTQSSHLGTFWPFLYDGVHAEEPGDAMVLPYPGSVMAWELQAGGG